MCCGPYNVLVWTVLVLFHASVGVYRGVSSLEFIFGNPEMRVCGEYIFVLVWTVHICFTFLLRVVDCMWVGPEDISDSSKGSIGSEFNCSFFVMYDKIEIGIAICCVMGDFHGFMD